MEEANLSWHASVRKRADPWGPALPPPPPPPPDLGAEMLIQKAERERQVHEWGKGKNGDLHDAWLSLNCCAGMGPLHRRLSYLLHRVCCADVKA